MSVDESDRFGLDKAGRLDAARAEDLVVEEIAHLDPPFPFTMIAFDPEHFGIPANPETDSVRFV